LDVKRIILSVIAALFLPSIVGCHAFRSASSESSFVHRTAYCSSDRCDYGGLLDCPGQSPFGSHRKNCGMGGLLHKTTSELNALVHCLLSCEWEGGYPDGSCGPWVGHWRGCCGSGSMGETCTDCDGAIILSEHVIE